jgi:hypothetical protein
MEEDRPQWDEAFARALEGAVVLVGITHNDPAGPRQEQFYGTVIEANPAEGIALRLDGAHAGETYWLPPDLRAFAPASPGSYRLRATGEVVVDPDYTTSWTIDPPRH